MWITQRCSNGISWHAHAHRPQNRKNISDTFKSVRHHSAQLQKAPIVAHVTHSLGTKSDSCPTSTRLKRVQPRPQFLGGGDSKLIPLPRMLLRLKYEWIWRKWDGNVSTEWGPITTHTWCSAAQKSEKNWGPQLIFQQPKSGGFMSPAPQINSHHSIQYKFWGQQDVDVWI